MKTFAAALIASALAAGSQASAQSVYFEDNFDGDDLGEPRRHDLL